MSERLYRTQILLEPRQHQTLSEIAKREGRSISDVVRELIRAQLELRESAAGAESDRRLRALEEIRRHREEILAERGGVPLNVDVAELINEGRDERDEQILQWLNDRR